MVGMLLRDKVLLYQHNLAAQTWTNGKEMLRWNLAQGYSLSNSVFDESIPGLNMDNPWLNLVGVFQQHAIATYADERVTIYEDLGGVTRTRFETYTVYANRSGEQSYTLGGLTLPPGGVAALADDGSVTAGVFTRYGGHDLSAGDHYLVEGRAEDEIRLFQPIGDDTTLHINIPDWAAVAVGAYRDDSTLIASVDAALAVADVKFEYAGVVNGEPVGHYRVYPI